VEDEKITLILEKYRRKSISVTTDVLREEWDDNDYLDMLFFRQQLDDADLTPEQRVILAESDKRIADKMPADVLDEYISEERSLPIREWWSK
jgi:hypothetical protein